MPVIAVAAAIGSIAIAGSAVAATVGGIAAISAATAFSVVAAVGATVGAIGAVTRDKTLSMVGLGLGAVGGIGAIASSAGLFGASSAPLFGGEAAAAGIAGGGEGVAGFAAGVGGGEVAAPATMGAMTVSDASSGVIDFLAGVPEQPIPTDLTTLTTTAENATDPATQLLKEAGGGLINPTSDASKALAQTELDQLTAGGTFSGGTPPTPPMGGDVDPITNTIIAGRADPVTGKIVSMPEEDGMFGGVFGKIGDFAKKNPLTTYGVVQAAGSFLSGLTDEKTPAQIAALNAQAASNQAAANLLTQQQQNLAAPKAVAYSAPVTGAPQPIIPPIGLVNRPKPSPVTGVPA